MATKTPPIPRGAKPFDAILCWQPPTIEELAAAGIIITHQDGTEFTGYYFPKKLTPAARQWVP